MPAYSQVGIPEHAASESNAADNSVVVKNRVLGIPQTTPSNTFVGIVIAGLRALSAACGALIDSVNRKVTVTDDADSIAAFDAAADSGAHVATLTSDDPTKSAPIWSVDDEAELNSILGGEWGTALMLTTFNSGKSPESALNALVNRAGTEGKSVLLSVNQDAGTIKIASFANDGALTTAANTARTEADAPAAFETLYVPAIVEAGSTGPNWGL